MANGNIRSNIGGGQGLGLETVGDNDSFPSSPSDGDEVIVTKNNQRLLYVYDASLGTGQWRPRDWYVSMPSSNGEQSVFDPRIISQGEESLVAPAPHYPGIHDYGGVVADSEWVSTSIPSTDTERGMPHANAVQIQSVYNGNFVDPSAHSEHQQNGALTLRVAFRAESLDVTDHSYGNVSVVRIQGDDSSNSQDAILGGIAIDQSSQYSRIRYINEDNSQNNRICYWQWPFGFIDGQTYIIDITRDSSDVVRCYINGRKLNRIVSTTNGSDSGGSNGGGDFTPQSVATDGSRDRMKLRSDPDKVVAYAGQIWSSQQSRADLRTYRDEVAKNLYNHNTVVTSVESVMSDFAQASDIARLYPDTDNADGLTDQTGQTSSWDQTGVTLNVYDDYETASANGKSRWESSRSDYVTTGTITHRIALLYLDDLSGGTVAFYNLNPSSGNNMFKLRVHQFDDGSGNTELFYSHQHSSLTTEQAYYKVPKPRLGSAHIHTVSRVDNGDGTVSVRFYWDGQVQAVDSISSGSGSATTEDGGNTFTCPAPDNDSTYRWCLFGTRGGQDDMRSEAIGYWAESEYTTDRRETDIASALNLG